MSELVLLPDADRARAAGYARQALAPAALGSHHEHHAILTNCPRWLQITNRPATAVRLPMTPPRPGHRSWPAA